MHIGKEMKKAYVVFLNRNGNRVFLGAFFDKNIAEQCKKENGSLAFIIESRATQEESGHVTLLDVEILGSEIKQ